MPQSYRDQIARLVMVWLAVGPRTEDGAKDVTPLVNDIVALQDPRMSLDRETAREVLRWYTGQHLSGFEAALDALAGCVTDEPHTTDRDALYDLLDEMVGGAVDKGAWDLWTMVDRILALLQPDPRIAKIEALFIEQPALLASAWATRQVFAILRGEA